MGTKTKSSAGGMIALMVAVIVGAGFFYGLAKRAPSDERGAVVFTVTFEPAHRALWVEMLVTVDGALLETDRTRKSPWKTIVRLQKGQTATVTALQEVSAKLSCEVNGEVQETRETPGLVMCKHTRV